jgi:hypothetical protein
MKNPQIDLQMSNTTGRYLPDGSIATFDFLNTNNDFDYSKVNLAQEIDVICLAQAVEKIENDHATKRCPCLLCSIQPSAQQRVCK